MPFAHEEEGREAPDRAASESAGPRRPVLESLMPLVVWVAALIGIAIITVVGVMRPPTPPAITIYPECDMQVAMIKELQAKVKALEELNPARVQNSDSPEPAPFPPAITPKRPERSILIDPNSRIIGGQPNS